MTDESFIKAAGGISNSGKTAGDGNYIPGLDGLRAVAIGMVLAYHLGFPGSALGWAGVNLFFVISGFLITGILLKNREDEHYFRNFYGRRVLRIFPIYYLTLSMMFLPIFSKESGTGDGIYFFFYMQNYINGIRTWSVNFPLLYNHTWSLAIEEQFYLVWPLLVRFVRQKYLWFVIAGGFILAVLFRLYSVIVFPDKIALPYTALPAELDSLMAGAFLALLVRNRKMQQEHIARWGGRLFIVCGIATLLAFTAQAFFLYAGVAWFMLFLRVGLLTLLALCFLGMVAYVTQGKAPISLLLNLSPICYIGKISYGIYIYHPIVIFFVDKLAALLQQRQIVLPYAVWAAAKLAFTFVTAHFSWVLLEKPILKLKDRFAYRPMPAQPYGTEQVSESSTP